MFFESLLWTSGGLCNGRSHNETFVLLKQESTCYSKVFTNQFVVVLTTAIGDLTMTPLFFRTRIYRFFYIILNSFYFEWQLCRWDFCYLERGSEYFNVFWTQFNAVLTSEVGYLTMALGSFTGCSTSLCDLFQPVKSETFFGMRI